MAGVNQETARQLRLYLQDATVKCSERCLYQSAKWAAELASSLCFPPDDLADLDFDVDMPMQNTEQSQPAVPVVWSANPDPQEARLEAREAGKYLLAKAYFDCREFQRCAEVFLPPDLLAGALSPSSPDVNTTRPSPLKSPNGKSKGSQLPKQGAEPGWSRNTLPRLSQKALFLALYAKYMSGEKRKDEESEMILGPADNGSALNKELVTISRALEGWFASRSSKQSSSGWLEYLYGIVLAKGKNEEDAKAWLVRSLHLFPYNWGAWLELNDLIGSLEELQRISLELPQNIMTLIFILYANQELYQCGDPIHSQLNDLEKIFPSSHFLKTQRALLFYHSKDFDEAESIFSTILQSSPHRIDALDHYSNILYVMSARPKLAFLAHLASATDKFRPETCCVIGNYYSLKSEHEKAVHYFRRALTLDRSFLSAWTLMGHEYVEMKNTHAAIESYRRAVDVNRKDYRAWYGLGQTYEFLEMYLYALFYFQRAASLRPYDAKMWQGMGNCYNKIGQPAQSIRAYQRALVAGTDYESVAGSSFGSGAQTEPQVSGVMDPEILYQIGLMYERLNEMAEAANYMEMTVAQEEGDAEDGGGGTGVTMTTSKARMWLAKWEFGRGGLQRAMDLAEELCQDGVEVEEAQALKRDLRARMGVDGGD